VKTLIEMAREAELVYWMSNLARTKGRWWMDAGEPGEELERFAELVRADEREVCAKVCENYDIDIAAAIRARSKDEK